MNLLARYEQKQVKLLSKNREQVDFNVGDEVSVHVLISETASTERIQEYVGLCIAKRSNRVNSTFTIRKISHGEGVERTFLLYSPKVAKIVVTRRGKVRRSKLYYIRKLRGKAARIKAATHYPTAKSAKHCNAPKKVD